MGVDQGISRGVARSGQPCLEQKCDDLAKALGGFGKHPSEVVIEDVDQWVLLGTQQDRSYGPTKNTAFRFWRLLRDCGYTGKLPNSLLRPLEQFPPQLKSEVIELLRWKQVPFNFNRPKDERHRPVTAERLQHALCALYGYAKNICHLSEINSPSQLIQEQTVGGYVEWCMNVSNVKGQTDSARQSTSNRCSAAPSPGA